MEAVVATTGVTASANQTQLMTVDIPDDYAGWFMRPDQLVTGDEFVGPSFPLRGDVVWTHADPTPRTNPL